MNLIPFISLILVHTPSILSLPPVGLFIESRDPIQLFVDQAGANLTFKCQSDGSTLKNFTGVFPCSSLKECDDLALSCLDQSQPCPGKTILRANHCEGQQEKGECLSFQIPRQNFSSGVIQCSTSHTKNIDYVYAGTRGRIFLLNADVTKPQKIVAIEVTKGSDNLTNGAILHPNETVRVTCRVSKIPSGPISMAIIKGDSSQTPIDPNSFKVNDTLNLYVRYVDVKLEDGMDSFSCTSDLVAKMSAHDSTAKYHLIVTDPTKPYIINDGHESGRKIFNFNDLGGRLLCNVTNVQPTPDFLWFHNGTKIEMNNQTNYSMQVIHLDVSGSVTQSILTLPRVNFSIGGNYSCLAKNPVGQASFDFNVTVFFTKPTIQAEASQVTLTNGANQYLTCIAYGVPRPVVTWLYNGNAFNNFTTKHESNKTEISTITWLEVNDSIRGDYSCMATNTFGAAQFKIQVSVYSSKPIFLDGPKKGKKLDVKFSNGQTNRSVLCRVEGAPKADITWLYNGQPYQNFIQNFDNNLTTESSITWPTTANQSTAGGRYTCLAKNSLGSSSLEFKVNFNDGADQSGTFGNTAIIITLGAVVLVILIVAFGIFMNKNVTIQRLRESIRRLDVQYQQVL